jgi:hypothetical protein
LPNTALGNSKVQKRGKHTQRAAQEENKNPRLRSVAAGRGRDGGNRQKGLLPRNAGLPGGYDPISGGELLGLIGAASRSDGIDVNPTIAAFVELEADGLLQLHLVLLVLGGGGIGRGGIRTAATARSRRSPGYGDGSGRKEGATSRGDGGRDDGMVMAMAMAMAMVPGCGEEAG